MRMSDVSRLLGLTQLTTDVPDCNVQGGYTSDLLSDVMAHAQPGELLITIQAHKNTVAVATVADIPAIVVCNSRPVAPEMLESATEQSIVVCVTSDTQFTVSGKLFALFHGDELSS